MSRFESLLTKIHNKFKDYCEFRSTCPYFNPTQFTCNNKGGSHCGKYRRFKAKSATRINNTKQNNEALSLQEDF